MELEVGEKPAAVEVSVWFAATAEAAKVAEVVAAVETTAGTVEEGGGGQLAGTVAEPAQEEAVVAQESNAWIVGKEPVRAEPLTEASDLVGKAPVYKETGWLWVAGWADTC